MTISRETTFFKVVTITFCGLLTFFSLIFILARREERSARQYLVAAVPRLVWQWDPKAFTDEATPEFVKAFSRIEVANLFNICSNRLGALKSCESPSGAIRLLTTPPGRPVLVGDYWVVAHFEKAAATIHVGLIRSGGAWHIQEFYVFSDVFLKTPIK
jgi:hypothetical protein